MWCGEGGGLLLKLNDEQKATLQSTGMSGLQALGTASVRSLRVTSSVYLSNRKNTRGMGLIKGVTFDDVLSHI